MCEEMRFLGILFQVIKKKGIYGMNLIGSWHFFKERFIFLKKDYLFIRERERESTCTQVGGRRRKSQPDSLMSAEPDLGLDLRTLLRPWPEPKPRVRCSSDWAIQVPQFLLILKIRNSKWQSLTIFQPNSSPPFLAFSYIMKLKSGFSSVMSLDVILIFHCCCNKVSQN